MSDSWGTSPPPPPGSQRSAPPAPGGYRPQPASEPKGSSGAFRDTLIVAGLAVAGVAGMLIWSGGDVSTGAEIANSPDIPEFTMPPGLTLPEISTGGGVAAGVATAPQPTTGLGGDPGMSEADVIARDALMAVLPVPNGGTEVPPDGAGVRSWVFTATDWQTARDDYLGVLRGQGYIVTLLQAINQPGVVGEEYSVADPTGTITITLQVGEANGQIVVEVRR